MAAIQDGLHTTTLEKLVPFRNIPNTPPTHSSNAGVLPNEERWEVCPLQGGGREEEGEHKGSSWPVEGGKWQRAAGGVTD